jgi:hypothetical protein
MAILDEILTTLSFAPDALRRGFGIESSTPQAQAATGPLQQQIPTQLSHVPTVGPQLTADPRVGIVNSPGIDAPLGSPLTFGTPSAEALPPVNPEVVNLLQQLVPQQGPRIQMTMERDPSKVPDVSDQIPEFTPPDQQPTPSPEPKKGKGAGSDAALTAASLSLAGLLQPQQDRLFVAPPTGPVTGGTFPGVVR